MASTSKITGFPNSSNTNNPIIKTALKPQFLTNTVLRTLSLVGAFFTILALTTYLLYLVFIIALGVPTNVTIEASDASLSELGLNLNNNTATLRYNLNFTLTTSNPNSYVGFYYDTIKATAYYEGQELGNVSFPPFYQETRSTYSMFLAPIVFNGEANGINREKLQQKTTEGTTLSFEVDVSLETRYAARSHVSRKTEQTVHCVMNVAVPGGTGITRNYLCSNGPNVSILKW